MNFGEMRTAVRDVLATTSGDQLNTTEVIDRFINRAVQAVSVHKDWSWLDASATITTTASQAAYTLPNDYLRTVSVTNVDNEMLVYVSASDVDASAEIESPDPIYYTVVDGEMILVPTPQSTAVLRHRYRRREPALVNDTDQPLLPTAYRSAIVEYALALCHRRARDEARAATAMDAYRSILDDVNAIPLQTTSTGRIKVRSGGWMG